MARLNNPINDTLVLKDFEKFPVWTWDDEMIRYLPVSGTLSWREYSTYFIKAQFKTNGYVFDGYLIGNETFYAFALFTGDKKFIFNINLPSLNKITLIKLFETLVCNPFEFFPIYHESSVQFEDGVDIKGTLSFPLEGKTFE